MISRGRERAAQRCWGSARSFEFKVLNPEFKTLGVRSYCSIEIAVGSLLLLTESTFHRATRRCEDDCREPRQGAVEPLCGEVRTCQLVEAILHNQRRWEAATR